MRSYITILFLFLLACNKSSRNTNQSFNLKNKSEQKIEFTEIGNKNLPLFNFPKRWYVQVYDEAPPMNREDSANQKKMEQLDFFDEVKCKIINKNKYNEILMNKKEKLDSLFLIDSISIANRRLLYIKYYKTLNYDSSPKEKGIDILIYDKNRLVKRINAYSNKSYPYAVEKKVGYLDKSGILYTKTFEIDEEGVSYVKSEKINCNDFLK
ncbi:hypothetical protein OF897_07015 [Chryseobacterium formosus]|uniref:Lipoprotein n=1 Tax=Chryseobacterium formosus TaxID=1537363 RepID=A0ABT3XNF5_9FLAO|nr:hypothetical protein [Chryseobacterium formosus]MCX8523671.1 hypothetical protein [Chryseobacterium formosus]